MSIEDKLEYLILSDIITEMVNESDEEIREKQADSLDNMLYRYDELRDKIIEEYRLPDKR